MDEELQPHGSAAIPPAPFAMSSARLPGAIVEVAQPVLEEFGRRVSIALSAAMNTNVEAAPASVADSTFGEFIQQDAGSPRCLAVLTSFGGEARTLVNVGPSLAFPVVEVLLGGKVGDLLPQARSLTEIEIDLLRAPLRLVATALAESWKKFVTLEYETEIVDGGVLVSRVIQPDRGVTVISMRVLLDGSVSGYIELAVTEEFWRAVSTVMRLVDGPPANEEDSGRREGILDLLEPAEMHFDVMLHACRLTLGDLLSMQPGKIILLDHTVDAPVTGVLNGSDQFAGQVVVRGGRRAFCVGAC